MAPSWNCTIRSQMVLRPLFLAVGVFLASGEPAILAQGHDGENTPVLVLSDDVQRKDLRFVTAALDPGGDAGFGTKLTVEAPSYLNKGKLGDFAAIVLADVARLSDAELTALTKRVSAGGGLLLFLGPQVDARWYNETLYSDGKGLLPAPLGKVERREWTEAENLQSGKHASFAPFAGTQAELLRSVYVARWHTVRDGWKAPADGSVKRVAALAETIPLIVEKRYGKGRVLAVYSFPSEDWTQWQTTPAWVIWLHAAVDYLAGKQPQKNETK